MKATAQSFHLVLFIMLYKVVLTFGCMDETLVWPFQWEILSTTFIWYCLESHRFRQTSDLIGYQREVFRVELQGYCWLESRAKTVAIVKTKMQLVLEKKHLNEFTKTEFEKPISHSSEISSEIQCGIHLSGTEFFYSMLCKVDQSNFRVYGWNPGVWPFKWKLLSSTFMCYFVVEGESNTLRVKEVKPCTCFTTFHETASFNKVMAYLSCNCLRDLTASWSFLIDVSKFRNYSKTKINDSYFSDTFTSSQLY